MNPSEQQDLEDVFGPEGAAKVAGFTKGRAGASISDRYAENLARRKGSPLPVPDMRKGKRPTGSKYQFVLIDPGKDAGRGVECSNRTRSMERDPKPGIATATGPG
jgi:hypothetical protein